MEKLGLGYEIIPAAPVGDDIKKVKPPGKVADYFKRATRRKAFVKAMRMRNA